MRIAALFFMLYIVVIKIIVGSIIISLAGTVSTIAYLILRKDVDGTEMGDIYIEEEDEETYITGADKTEFMDESVITTEDTSVQEEAVSEKPVPPAPNEPEIKKTVHEKPEEPNTTDHSSDNNGSSPEKQE